MCHSHAHLPCGHVPPFACLHACPCPFPLHLPSCLPACLCFPLPPAFLYAYTCPSSWQQQQQQAVSSSMACHGQHGPGQAPLLISISLSLLHAFYYWAPSGMEKRTRVCVYGVPGIVSPQAGSLFPTYLPRPRWVDRQQAGEEEGRQETSSLLHLISSPSRKSGGGSAMAWHGLAFFPSPHHVIPPPLSSSLMLPSLHGFGEGIWNSCTSTSSREKGEKGGGGRKGVEEGTATTFFLGI